MRVPWEEGTAGELRPQVAPPQNQTLSQTVGLPSRPVRRPHGVVCGHSYGKNSFRMSPGVERVWETILLDMTPD